MEYVNRNNIGLNNLDYLQLDDTTTDMTNSNRFMKK
jgi:hypothetical protein